MNQLKSWMLQIPGSSGTFLRLHLAVSEGFLILQCLEISVIFVSPLRNFVPVWDFIIMFYVYYAQATLANSRPKRAKD